MVSNFIAYALMYAYFLISLRFIIQIWNLRRNHTFVYTGIYLSNFMIFNIIPWIFNLVQLWFIHDLKLSSALSLSFIVMKLFANFNLMMFALRMVRIPKFTFRTLNLIVFLIGYSCLLFLPIFLPKTFPQIYGQSYPMANDVTTETIACMEMRPIHVLFGLSTMPDSFVVFNTILFLIYLVFYLITYFVVIKHAMWAKENIYGPGLGVVYNIVQLLTVNIFINGISMIPSMHNSYFLLTAIWISYNIISLNCFNCIVNYTKMGMLFLRD